MGVEDSTVFIVCTIFTAIKEKKIIIYAPVVEKHVTVPDAI